MPLQQMPSTGYSLQQTSPAMATAQDADSRLKLALLIPHFVLAGVILILFLVDFLLYRRRSRLHGLRKEEKTEIQRMFPKRPIGSVFRPASTSPKQDGVAGKGLLPGLAELFAAANTGPKRNKTESQSVQDKSKLRKDSVDGEDDVFDCENIPAEHCGVADMNEIRRYSSNCNTTGRVSNSTGKTSSSSSYLDCLAPENTNPSTNCVSGAANSISRPWYAPPSEDTALTDSPTVAIVSGPPTEGDENDKLQKQNKKKRAKKLLLKRLSSKNARVGVCTSDDASETQAQPSSPLPPIPSSEQHVQSDPMLHADQNSVCNERKTLGDYIGP